MKKLFRWAMVLSVSAALYPVIVKNFVSVPASQLNKDEPICTENSLAEYETVTDAKGTRFIFRHTVTLGIDESDVTAPQTEEELIQLARDMYKQADEGDEIIYVGESTADYGQSGKLIDSAELSEEDAQCNS